MITGFACAEDFKILPPSVSLTPENTYKTQELKDYFNELKDFAQTKWVMKDVKNDSANKVLASFKIDQDGFITEPKIVFSSGSLLVDRHVLDTINELKQFKPLPKSFQSPILVKLYFNPSQKQYAGGGKEPDFGPYMRELQRQIKKNWNPPKGNESKRVVLMFKIAKDGRLLSCFVHKSSDDPETDKAALDALQKAMPFKPLPSEFKGSSVDILFTFDYNVWGRTDRPAYNKPVRLASQSVIVTLDDKLYVTNKNSSITRYGYKYVNAVKFSGNMPYFWQCKLDCKNRQIGVKKSYAGTSDKVIRDLNLILQSNFMFYENVKMQSIDKNQDYLKMYNYVCQP